MNPNADSSQVPGNRQQHRVQVTARSFTTQAGQASFEAAFAKTLALWPVPFERFDLETRFGPTHVIAAGPADAPPLLLLHAFSMAASSWYANVGEWSRHYRIYAIDTMADTTNSVMTVLIKQRAEYALWLGDVMDALGVDRAPLVGHSYGGWISLNMALCAPERVEKIALCAPAASFVPLNFRFSVQTVLQLFSIFFRKRWPADAFVRWISMDASRHPEMAEQFYQAVANFKWANVVRPNVYTDDELKQIKTPILLMYGDHEVILDTKTARQRASRLLENLEIEIIPGASHALIMEQPEQINRRMLQFLKP